MGWEPKTCGPSCSPPCYKPSRKVPFRLVLPRFTSQPSNTPFLETCTDWSSRVAVTTVTHYDRARGTAIFPMGILWSFLTNFHASVADLLPLCMYIGGRSSSSTISVASSSAFVTTPCAASASSASSFHRCSYSTISFASSSAFAATPCAASASLIR